MPDASYPCIYFLRQAIMVNKWIMQLLVNHIDLKFFFFKDFFGVSLELEEGNLHAVKENEDEGITRSDFDKERTVFKPHQLNEFFNVNPIEFKNKTFENDKDVFVKEIQIDLNSVIESYQKSISIKNVFIQQ